MPLKWLDKYQKRTEKDAYSTRQTQLFRSRSLDAGIRVKARLKVGERE